MQPKKVIKHSRPEDLFRSRLVQILIGKHPLFVLAQRIDWSVFEGEFGALYCENVERPGLPVGLHYLKHAYGESDKSVSRSFAGQAVIGRPQTARP